MHMKINIITRAICYKKELAWKIENFEDWLSSREQAQSERMQSENSTEEEELLQEVPKDWNKSTLSPIIKFEIEGIQHEFMIAVLKYDSYDRFDKDHNDMMGISLYYNSPSKSIIIKPLFSIQEDDYEVQNPLQAKICENGSFSESRIFSCYNLLANKDVLFPENNLHVRCLVQVNVLKDFPSGRNLERNVLSKKTWNQSLLDDFDFKSKTSDWDKFSDFDIICVEKSENGDTNEKIFRCHKLVLSLGSRYYKRMLSGNYREIDGTARVTDIPIDTMTKLIQYIYSGEINKKEIDVNLLLAADKYEILHLKSLCELELGQRITIENACRMSIVAKMCGSKVFKDHVYSFVREHWPMIIGTKDSEMLQRNPEVLWEILDGSAI